MATIGINGDICDRGTLGTVTKFIPNKSAEPDVVEAKEALYVAIKQLSSFIEEPCTDHRNVRLRCLEVLNTLVASARYLEV
nr:hypothetical protein 11 [bacterium]